MSAYLDPLFSYNTYHLIAFVWVESAKEIDPKRTILSLMRGFQQYMGWNDFEMSPEGFERMYYTTKNMLKEGGSNASPESFLNEINSNGSTRRAQEATKGVH